MVWKPWIEMKPLETEEPDIMELYRRTGAEAANGNPSDLVRLTSSTPEVSSLLFDLSRAVHANASGLSQREQYMAALIVATYNGCVH